LVIIPTEWLIDYIARTGVSRISFDKVVVLKDGFFTFSVRNDYLVILDGYGNGKRIEQVCMKIAKSRGLKKIRFFSRRNPKAFVRKFGVKVIGKTKEGFYLFEKEVV